MWLDNRRVFNASDCATDDKGRTKLFPVPYSTCHGVCAFSTYWLLLDQPKWQFHRALPSIGLARRDGCARYNDNSACMIGVCVTVANANGQSNSEPSRRLMETIRPFTRNNLYGNLESLSFIRAMMSHGKPKRSPLSFLDRPGF